MTSRTHQASPEAIDAFGRKAKRAGDGLESALSSKSATVLRPSGKLDNFGVLDQLTAVYPASAKAALEAVERYAKVLDELAAASRTSAARFREADKPVQGQG